MNELLRADETIEDLQLNGLKLIQKKTAFRFGMDSVILADFADIRENDIVADFGTGNGILILLLHGRKKGKKYGCLRNNHLINSTRKYDDMGDWLYLKLMLCNIGTFIKAALGDRSGLDKMLDKLFYDYND